MLPEEAREKLVNHWGEDFLNRVLSYALEDISPKSHADVKSAFEDAVNDVKYTIL